MSTDIEQDPFAALVEGANLCALRALSGDRESALLVISQSVIAIRSMLQFEELDPSKLRLDTRDMEDPRKLIFNEPPDPHRLVYLRALAALLDRVLAGDDPTVALSLVKPPHRETDPNLGIRDVTLFVQVGQEFDRLKERGHTREDKPLQSAIKSVSKARGVSQDVVQKAWSKYGSASGWEERRADWK